MLNIVELTVNFKLADQEIAALSNLSLTLSPGEYAAVIGPNGSGKSTLLKAICGLVPPASGHIAMLGENVIYNGFAKNFFGKVGVVFQEPESQFIMPSTELEILAVLQNFGLNHKEQQRRFDALIKLFDLQNLVESNPEALSGGQMQLINLATALATGPQILLLDEPTTFLDNSYKEKFLSYLRQMHKQGLTILHITQYPDEALDCDSVFILNNGHITSSGSSQAILSDASLLESNRIAIPSKLLLQNKFGIASETDISDFCARILLNDPIPQKQVPEFTYPTTVTAHNLRHSFKSSNFSLQVDNLEIFEGQIIGIIGPVGSGKTTLAMILAGLIKQDCGGIKYGNLEAERLSQSEIRTNISMIFQFPELTLIGPSVKEEIEFGTANINIRYNIDQLLARIGLPNMGERIVDSLSGGDKRKLQIANLLINPPLIAILDEPFAFLDSFSQNDIIELLRNLSGSIKTLILISHNIEALSELANRIIGMREGSIQFDISASEFFNDYNYCSEIGIAANYQHKLRTLLTGKGIVMPFISLDPEKIYEYLKDKGIWA